MLVGFSSGCILESFRGEIDLVIPTVWRSARLTPQDLLLESRLLPVGLLKKR